MYEEVSAAWRLAEAGDRIRTGDPNLGKVVLYQLSYTRVASRKAADYIADSPFLQSQNIPHRDGSPQAGFGPLHEPLQVAAVRAQNEQRSGACRHHKRRWIAPQEGQQRHDQRGNHGRHGHVTQ